MSVKSVKISLDTHELIKKISSQIYLDTGRDLNFGEVVEASILQFEKAKPWLKEKAITT